MQLAEVLFFVWPARAIPRTWAGKLVLLLGLAISFCAGGAAAQSQAPDSTVYSVPILVSDFELFSVAMQPRTGTPSASSADQQKPKSPPVYNDADAPFEQARRLTDFFATTLVRTLQAKGFRASRSARQAPAVGAQIRGVFAELDAMNRIRRALLGGGSPSPRVFLYVGIFDRARQEQPLYEPAPEQPTGGQYGPVITLNTYVPLAKYELDKNPSEEDVKKICEQIAANLVTLLEKNPNALTQDGDAGRSLLNPQRHPLEVARHPFMDHNGLVLSLK